MKIAVLHGEIVPGAGPDELDGIREVVFVSEALQGMGHEPFILPVSLNLEKTALQLEKIRPEFVFNLVESLSGQGSLIHLVPALLDSLHIRYTGAATEAMFLTSNKLLAKRALTAAGVPTPEWFLESAGEEREETGDWIIKSLWEHASLGLDEESVLFAASRRRIGEEIAHRRESGRGEWFAERFIAGREFNVSLLARPGTKAGGRGGERKATGEMAMSGDERGQRKKSVAPEILPPAEIHFDAYPPGKPRIVGYRAKWEEDSFEFAATQRTFSFAAEDARLLRYLRELSLQCWRLFDLRGYARVDFRVDAAGQPWILEVNANPCLSPDAGFIAACEQAGLSRFDIFSRLIEER